MAKTIDKIKDFGKDIRNLVIAGGILLIPYVAMQSCEQTAYGLIKGQREYVECAGLRTVENRRNVLNTQNQIFNNLYKKIIGENT